jgi:hypothetical protein
MGVRAEPGRLTPAVKPPELAVVVALARAGSQAIARLAADLRITESCPCAA